MFLSQIQFQNLSHKRPLLKFLKWPRPPFRPEIGHLLLFSVSSKQPPNHTWSLEIITQMSQKKSVFNSGHQDCLQIITVNIQKWWLWLKSVDKQNQYSDLLQNFNSSTFVGFSRYYFMWNMPVLLIFSLSLILPLKKGIIFVISRSVQFSVNFFLVNDHLP